MPRAVAVTFQPRHLNLPQSSRKFFAWILLHQVSQDINQICACILVRLVDYFHYRDHRVLQLELTFEV